MAQLGTRVRIPLGIRTRVIEEGLGARRCPVRRNAWFGGTSERNDPLHQHAAIYVDKILRGAKLIE
jgi:hypothetical protein